MKWYKGTLLTYFPFFFNLVEKYFLIVKKMASSVYETDNCSAYTFISIQIKFIFIRMVLHLDSFWNRSTRELGNGPIQIAPQQLYVKYREVILGNLIHLRTVFSCKPVQDMARFVCVKLMVKLRKLMLNVIGGRRFDFMWKSVLFTSHL